MREWAAVGAARLRLLMGGPETGAETSVEVADHLALAARLLTELVAWLDAQASD